MPRTRRVPKLLTSLLLMAVTLLVSAGVILYLLTRPVQIEFAQDPNPLEAHEANRKLKLLTEALESKRLGYIRLSEVEINSFLETRYNDPKQAPTNNSPVKVVKAGVLLHHTNLTFVTWMKAPALGINLPFVWQRTVEPRREGKKWAFKLTEMHLGKLNIPEQIWPHVNRYLAGADAVFEERKSWLADMPRVTLVRNELSKTPELRLFSYEPGEKGGL